jgi:DNA-binding NarL/FixJ family response regulator
MVRMGMEEVPRINLEARISVDAVKILEKIFKGGVPRLTNAEISKESGISERTVKNLKYIQPVARIS